MSEMAFKEVMSRRKRNVEAKPSPSLRVASRPRHFLKVGPLYLQAILTMGSMPRHDHVQRMKGRRRDTVVGPCPRLTLSRHVFQHIHDARTLRGLEVEHREGYSPMFDAF